MEREKYLPLFGAQILFVGFGVLVFRVGCMKSSSKLLKHYNMVSLLFKVSTFNALQATQADTRLRNTVVL